MQFQNQNRLHSLDILRSIAIIFVMCWHLPKIEGKSIVGFFGTYGLWGVDLFFILSGYLIGNQLFRALKRDNKISFYNFYIRRALRTWPNYLVILGLYLAFPGFREHPDMPATWKFLTFTQNFNLAFSAFSHAWSLCIEEQFYFVFPIAAFLLWKARNWKWTVGFIVAVIFGGLALRGILWLINVYGAIESNGEYFSKIYYPTWGRLDGLTFGVSIAAIKILLPNLWTRFVQYGNWFLGLGIVTLAVGFWIQTNRLSLIGATLGFPTISLGFALLVTSALCPSSLLQKLRVPGAGIVATLSFALYLLHKQIFHMTNIFFHEAGMPAVILISFVCSFTAAAILYFIVEKPFLLLRERIAPMS